MKLDSHWFEKVRIEPRRPGKGAPAAAPAVAGCDHPGCGQAGPFRAPKGRNHEGQYFNFCVDHVREYNASYDYFKGMTDEALAEYQKAASTGHRPTWTIGVNETAKEARARARNGSKHHGMDGTSYADPFDLFAAARKRAADKEKAKVEPRPIKNVERQSFEAMDLEVAATPTQIRARYKELVKRLHPDANGGDRGSEGKLREIIQAYKYLRQAGLA